MTTLRALVGAGFLLAVMGIVVAVPLAWILVLGIGEAYPEKLIQGRPDQRNAALGQKKIFPRTTYKHIRYKIEAKQKEEILIERSRKKFIKPSPQLLGISLFIRSPSHSNTTHFSLVKRSLPKS
jgi:hypothetical protein